MSKRKSNKMISAFASLLFGAGTAACLFLEAVNKTTQTGNTKTVYAYTGAQVAFGSYKGSMATINFTTNFSIMACLAFLLPIVAAILYTILIKKFGLISCLVSTAAFVFAAVVLFMIPSVTSLQTTGTLTGYTSTSTFADMEFGLGIGAIIGGICASLGAVSSLSYLFIK